MGGYCNDVSPSVSFHCGGEGHQGAGGEALLTPIGRRKKEEMLGVEAKE